VLCTAGAFTLESAAQTLQLSRGDSAFITAEDLPVSAISRSSDPATLFAASAQEKSN
jgi:Phosphomannose isomerase